MRPTSQSPAFDLIALPAEERAWPFLSRFLAQLVKACLNQLRLLPLLLGLGLAFPAAATIVFVASSSGINTGLPADGSPGAMTINRPATATPGMAMIISIAARPSQMTWVAPTWLDSLGVAQSWTQLSVAAEQLGGGVSTAPGGMTMRTYYRIVGLGEPNSYTWTFANTIGAGASGGGSAVGGMLVFSGIDTSTNPLDTTASSLLNASGLTHRTTAITTVTNNAMVVSMISYLSAGSFANPTCNPAVVPAPTITEALDVRAPAAAAAVGTTLQMSYFTQATAGLTCATQSVASSNADTGVGHLLALRPSTRDLTLAMTRNVPLSPGGTASYTMTINNAGSASEPGPLTVVDTLPAGLSYASVSGTGWSCSVAGQVVSCQKTGALAAGTSATPLIINVSVGAGVSGIFTNTATASGTGGDGNTANNTAIDTYVISATPYIYYPMDETSWSGGVNNTGSSAVAGTVLGAAAATGATPPVPPGSAIGGSPGTCGAGRIPSGTTAIGVDTNTDVNTLGNAGTIAFWYNSSAAWNDGNSRMLFDASNELGGGGADRHFFLAKDNAGRLVFALEDSADLDSTATSPAYTFAANTWHHIAVTWDLSNDRVNVYLDGNTTPVATSNTNVNGTLGNMATLYLGARRFTTISGTPAAYTSNTANGYMDEVRIYTRELAAIEIAAVYNLVHACASAVDHYELQLVTPGVACTPTNVKVTACADTSSPCTNPQTGVENKTANLATTAGTLTATTVTFDATGVANTSLNYPAASDGASAIVTLSGEQQSATNSRQCCPNGAGCVAASSCTATFNTAGLIISAAADAAAATIANQISGAGSASYYLRAIKTNSTTKACEAAITGTTSIDLAYQCNNPTTCTPSNLMTVTAAATATIARNNNSGVSSYLPVSMVFDANGNAPFTFNYADVGQISLYARATVNSATISGGSNSPFVVSPYGFTLSATCADGTVNAASQSSPGAGDPRFCRAGQGFTASITAINQAGNAAPNYGRETTPETVSVVWSRQLPAAGASGAPPSGSFPNLSNGVFTPAAVPANPLSWDEVGILNAVLSVGDGNYLGANNVSTTAYAGRFYPDHFDVVLTPQCGGFVYSGRPGTPAVTGQPFTVSATAMNGKATPTVTTNYNTTGGFARNVDLTLSAGGGAGKLYVDSTQGGSGAIPSTKFAAGIGQVNFNDASGKISYVFDVFPTAATTISLHADDADSAPSTGTNGSTGARAGKLRLENSYGSELLPLRVTVLAMYWNTAGWTTNTSDSCTTLPNQRNNLAIGNQQGTLTALNYGSSKVPAAPLTLGNGVGSIVLAVPAAGTTGSADIALNLGSAAADASCNTTHPATTGAGLAWLQSNWGGSPACPSVLYDRDPNARIRLGSPKAPYIYLRERH